jgi:signal transduction histidine kinase
VIPDLLRTSAFRLTLAYMALFAISMLILLGFAYWTTASYVNEQTDDDIEAEMQALRKQFRIYGLDGLRQTIAQRAGALEESDGVLMLAGRDWSPVAGNVVEWPGTVRESSWSEEELRVLDDDQGQSEGIRARTLAATLPNGYRLLVGRDLDDRDDLREHMLQVFVATVGIGLIMALTIGFVMSRVVLHRIESINRAGRSIVAGNLTQRIPVTGKGDEFDQLAINLNVMLTRIQRLIEGMRQVTDNVAHDLRSPLTRARTRLEVALLNPRSDEEYRAAIEQTLADVEALLATFNALLSIAQAESGAERGEWEGVDLSALAGEIVELYQPLAEDRGIQLTQHIAPKLCVRGNRHLLTQAIGNLLDNAIKYTPSGGAVQLAAKVVGGVVEVCVQDNGPGIPAQMREKVLQRFVRLESSRTTPGNGLGLSLVRAVAQLHRASLELADANRGLKVSLKFPADQ